ncbi:MAG: hypothetical protein JW729_10075 [Bacteroidales bacterium]|nr:hypothetical protein [Bacteroidales bacterium]
MAKRIPFLFWMIVVSITFLFSACTDMKLSKLVSTDPKPILKENLLLASQESSAKYKVNIEAFHQKMSGILMVKSVNKDTLRLLMITELGLKVFDVSFYSDDTFLVNYIMNHLDHPYIKNVIFENLQTLWPKENPLFDTSLFYSKRKKQTIIVQQKKDSKCYYFYSDALELTEIIPYVKAKRKSSIEVSEENNEFLIHTKRPTMQIRLKKISDVIK